MKWLALIGSSLFVIQHLLTLSVAASPNDKGLLITPPRQYLTVDPGGIAKSSFTVANLTENTLDVTFSVEHFSVADYTYMYTFDLPKEDWVKLEQTKATLKKSESRTISYAVAAPADAAPGGHYFTLFASTSLGEGRKVRAATVLYVTASGALSKQSDITRATVPLISFGEEIPYSLDIKNTGNTHFIAYTAGVMQGILPPSPPSAGETAHVILPDTTRSIEEKMPPPLLPGFYRAVVGYRDEDGHNIHQTHYSVYAPPWAFALIGGAIWLGVLFYKRRRGGLIDS